MFEHFIFGAQSQTQNLLQDDDAFPSPTDTSFPSPLTPPPTSFPFPSTPGQAGINDLVAKLSQQTLQQERERDHLVQQFQAWQKNTPDLEIEIDDDALGSSSEQSQNVSSPPTSLLAAASGTVACRRLQRQLNVQLQSCASHVRDISALVEEMIESNSQCTLRKSPSRSFLATPPPSRGRDLGSSRMLIDPTEFEEPRIVSDDVDEGFCEGEGLSVDEELEMSLRRASTPSGIRKYNMLRYGRSADVVTIGGKVKVRNVPRMRKRKVATVPE